MDARHAVRKRIVVNARIPFVCDEGDFLLDYKEISVEFDTFNEKINEILDGIDGGAFAFSDLEKDALVYHYTSLDGLKAILDSGIFQLTDYHYLNDETEFNYMEKLLLEIVKEDFFGAPFWDSLIASIAEYRLTVRFETEALEHSYYVASFSKARDNLTLWAEFASYGCNMGVNPGRMFADDMNLRYFGSVIYSLEEQKKVIRDAIRTVMEHFFPDLQKGCLLREYMKCVDEQQARLLAIPIVKLVSYYGMAMKNPLYKAEEEFRMVFSAKGRKIHFKRKGNLFVPYIEVPLDMESGFDALQSVTLAPLCRGTLERNSIEHYLRSKGIGNPDVKNSEIVLRY